MRQFSIDTQRAAAYLAAGDAANAAERAFFDRQADIRQDIAHIEVSAKAKGQALDDRMVAPALDPLRKRLAELRTQHEAGAARRQYDQFMASKVRAAMPSDRLPLPFIARAL